MDLIAAIRSAEVSADRWSLWFPVAIVSPPEVVVRGSGRAGLLRDQRSRDFRTRASSVAKRLVELKGIEPSTS